jgi:CheY-like chemotaxis protein
MATKKKKDKKKILIVDDEPSVRQLVKRFLGNNYTVLEAKDGIEAITVVNTQKPDLILMDIMMPKMDGLAACNIIKSNRATNEIPVVMLTGVDHELNKKLSLELGASAYITKPFSLQDLQDVIARFSRSPK